MIGINPKEIKGVAWDFDGVIADTIPLHLEARKASFEEFGFTEFTPEEHGSAHHIYGSTPRQVIGGLIRSKYPDIEQTVIDNVVAKKDELYGLFVRERAAPIEGIEQLIKATFELVNGNQIVVTSGYKVDIIPALSRLGLDHYFSAHAPITHDDVSEHKPHPEPYLAAYANLRLETPSSMLVIEDTPPGIESAKTAGARVIALTTTAPAEKLAAADAVCSVREAVQLLVR